MTGSMEKSSDCISEIRPSMYQRLTRERDGVKKRLNELNEAINMLDSNPEIKDVINTLSKITHF